MIRKLTLTALIALSFCAKAQTADTPETRKTAAEKLIQSVDDLMGPERMMQGMRGAMQAPLMEGLRNHPKLSDAQKKRAAQVMGDEMGGVMGEMMKAMKPALYAAMTQLYTERFSVGEIEELQRFYASSVVRKATTLTMEEMPRLMQPMMAGMRDWAPKIQERMQAAQATLKAEGIDISPPQQQPQPAQTPAPAAKPAPKKKP
jgi:hypothetical protein